MSIDLLIIENLHSYL